MVVVYTNSVPINIAYTNINHFYRMAEFKPLTTYVNFWDNFAINHPATKGTSLEEKKRNIFNNIEIYEKIISHIGVSTNRLIYSDSSNRLLRDKVYWDIFEKILSKISTQDLMKGFGIKNLEFKDLTLSNISNIIIDYLVAVFITDLYPHKNFIRPEIYLTSERFKLFFPIIEKILNEECPEIKLPMPHYVTLPFLLDPIEMKLPVLGMDIKEISKILENYYLKNEINGSEVRELIDILGRVVDSFKYNGYMIDKNSFILKLKLYGKNEFIGYLSVAFEDFYKKIEEIIYQKNNEIFESITLCNIEKFSEKIKPLNSLKLKILRLCNGTNSSEEIARTLKLNQNTVAVYITQLRKNNMVTSERNPKRINDFITLNFKEMN